MITNTSLRVLSYCLGFVVLSFLAGACSSPPASPAAPSAVMPNPAGPASADIEAPAASAFAPMASPRGRDRRRGEGIVSSLVPGTSCPSLEFHIGGHLIRTDMDTVYVDGVCDDIVVGSRLDAEVTEQPDGSFLAVAIRFRGNPRRKVEGEGRITALDAVARTITVERFEIYVPETAIIRQGDTPLAFEDLKIGYRVHVRAFPGVDRFEAEEIVVQETGRRVVEGEARVTALVEGTACPTLQFKIRDHVIATSEATMYEGGTCLDIQVGSRVQVKGEFQDDGTVLALRIHLKAAGVAGESVVTSLVPGTACPMLQFVVGGVTVHTDDATEYKGGVCSDIQPGVRVDVKGSSEPDGVHATHVHIKQ